MTDIEKIREGLAKIEIGEAITFTIGDKGAIKILKFLDSEGLRLIDKNYECGMKGAVFTKRLIEK